MSVISSSVNDLIKKMINEKNISNDVTFHFPMWSGDFSSIKYQSGAFYLFLSLCEDRITTIQLKVFLPILIIDSKR